MITFDAASSGPTKGVWANRKSVMYAVVFSLAAFQYGLDVGLTPSFMSMVGFLEIFGYPTDLSPTGWNISTTVQQLFSSLMVLGGIIGSVFQGFASPYLGGRRRDMQIGALFGMTAAAIMIGTTSLAAIYVARIFLGIANGIFITTAQMYIVEILPHNLRGVGLGVFAMVISIAITISQVITRFTKNLLSRLCYQIPLIVVLCVPVVILVLVQFAPESPRWLIMRNRSEDAKKALTRLRSGAYTEVEIASELAAMQAHHDEEHAAGKEKPKFFDIFKGTDLRRTILSVCIVATHVGSGTQFLVNYSTYFFTMAEVQNPFTMTIVVNVLGIVGTFVSLFSIRVVGRRTILIFGTSACGIAHLISAAVYTAHPGTVTSGKVLIAMCSIYNFFYCGTISPYAWTVGAELTSQRLRSYTIGLGSAVWFILGWVVTFTAPYFINVADLNWGPKYCWIWFVSCFIMVAWMAIFLPETKDRTLEELDEMFENHVPARKFKGYVCVRTLTAMEHGAAEQIVGMEKERDIQVEDIVVNPDGADTIIR